MKKKLASLEIFIIFAVIFERTYPKIHFFFISKTLFNPFYV